MKSKLFSTAFLAGGLGIFTVQVAAAQIPSKPVNSTAVIQAGTPGVPAQLSSSAEEILQLAHGGVNPDTLQSFIRNSYLDYDLSAAGITYLRQQGVSDAVISAMLQKMRDTITEAQTASRRSWNSAWRADNWRAWPYAMAGGGRGYPVYTEEPMPYDRYDNYYDGDANFYFFTYPARSSASNRRSEWENGLYRRWLGHQYFNGNGGFSGGVMGGGGAHR